MPNPHQLSPPDIEPARARRLAAADLQAAEGNPLSAEDTSMLEMFEREGRSHERCRAHILARTVRLAAQFSAINGQELRAVLAISRP